MTTVFGKIIAGEISADKVFENDRILVIKDLYPKAPVHLLIMPKKEIPDLQSLTEEDLPLIAEMVVIAQKLAEEFKITDGYRLIVNNGPLAGQSISHLHFHLIGGQKLGGMA
ncbi:MAG: Purine nucleoside phosphoramidase [Chlamydiae bacterium]|nr:Purine nucleoside phosphoramidase [Chlamydiota bacterium]